MLGASIVVLSLFAVLLIAAVAATLARSNDVTAMTSGGMAFGPVAGGLAIAGLFAFAATALFPGLIHQHGFDALVPLVGLAGGLVLLSVLVGPALARSGSATLPELVGRRFGRIPRALVLAISLAATAGLLLGCLGTGISIAARTLDVSTGTAALTASALILALVLPGGLKSTLAGSRAVAILAGTALITGLALLTTILLTNPIPHVAYGATLRDIGPAELNLIENGAVDFGVFKPFLRELLTIDRLNWALLSLALMGAIAALPPLVQATGAFTASSTRRGLAWALTFAVIALTAIPALAAIARLETYRAVSAGSAFSDLPNWIRRGSEAGAIRLHGTSLGMIDTVSRDVAAGATSIDAISTAMADRGARSEAVWQRLDPAVQEAVLDLARKFEAAPQLSSADRWSAYVDTVVTAASAASGNVTGKPDLASISIEPQDLAWAAPFSAGLPPFVSAMVLAIVLAAGAVLSAALVATVSGMLVRDGAAVLLGHDGGPPAEAALIRGAAIVVTIAFALAAAVVPVTADVVFVVSLSLCAAALLPALILTIWVPRATSWGVSAAVLTGLALGTYYLAGTALYGVAFYETWPALSSAGPDAYAEYQEARDLWIAAEGDDRAAAYADLASRTTGSLWSPGLANWFGIAPAAAPVLAVIFALAIGLLVSLLTPKPGLRAMDAHARMHGRIRSVSEPEIG